MDTRVFTVVLGVGIALVAIQGILAWVDSYLTRAQILSRGVRNGWSFLEHGGMWADVLVVSPVVAYLIAAYRFDFLSAFGLLALACTLAAVLIMGEHYRRNGLTTPEAHAHDGRTTPAGWVHGVFAVFALWTCTLFYLGRTSPPAALQDVIVISIILIPFTFLGIAKLNKDWRPSARDKWQVAFEIAALLGLIAFHAVRP